MGIGKCTDVFSFFFGFGGENLKGVMWEDLSMEEFVMREENFNEGLSNII